MMLQYLTQLGVQMQLLIEAQVVLDQGEDLVSIEGGRLDESSIIHKHE